jgi:hypothetical protein
LKRLSKASAQVEQKTGAQANNPAVLEGPFSPKSIPESSGNDNEIRLFSRELASYLNPERPDITGAMILYGLYLWQKTPIPKFHYVPMVNGQRGSYRSLSELSKEYPWMCEERIRKALIRLEKRLGKTWFIVDRKNSGAERKKLHFWISAALIKKFKFNAAWATLCSTGFWRRC